MYNSINGSTKVLGIIGDPIEHSLSPEIHNTICRELKQNYAYVPFKLPAKDIESAVNGFKALGVTGFNVTIPHKKNIIQYLDEVSEEALLMGAVNTVKNVQGKLYGYNTDGEGFIKSLKAHDVSVKNKNIVILGAGGAARGISVKIAMGGAKSITILNRTPEKAQEICDIINQNVADICKGALLDMNSLKACAHSCDILINTTPIGMHPHTAESPVENFSFLNSETVVCDLIYNPKKTLFLSNAEEKSCKIINGWGMLVCQAVSAYEIWTGININDNIIKKLHNMNKN